MVIRTTFAGTVSEAPVERVELEHFEATVSVKIKNRVARIPLSTLVQNENRWSIAILRPQPAQTSSRFD
jgi:hypothetical protein